MTSNDAPEQAAPNRGARSQILDELQPPLDALASDPHLAEPAAFDGYQADGQPRSVHPLDEPFDPNHPAPERDDGFSAASGEAPPFNFRSVTFAVGIVLGLLIVVWLRGAMGGGGEPGGGPALSLVRQAQLAASHSTAASQQPNQAAPPLSASAVAGALNPATNAGPATAENANNAQPLPAPGRFSPVAQGHDAEVAPANPADLAAAPSSPPTVPSDDPSLDEPANGGSSAGAPMNSAGNVIPPIAVIPLGPRPGQATAQRRGRTLQPAAAQVYEPRAQNYLDRAAASRRLGDKSAAAADYRHAMDDFNLAAAHGEDPLTAQAGLQTARDGLRQVGGH